MYVTVLEGGGGGLGGIPQLFGAAWDACQKISMEFLRGTNLGVAQVDFKP